MVLPLGPKLGMVFFVIAVLLGTIEEMELLGCFRHANLRMLAQKRIHGGSAAFLRPANYEINAHILATD